MDLLTSKEVCKMLRISYQTLWRMEKKKLISFTKLMGKKLYRREDLRKMIETKYEK